jgi:hypothetical protein
MFMALQWNIKKQWSLRSLVVLFCLQPCTFFGQSLPNSDSLDRIIRKSLLFIQNEQQTTTVSNSHFAGEWPSFMQMRTEFILLGNQKKVYDSNCFALAGMINLLSDMYRLDPSFTEIPPMLDRAYPQLISYRDSNGYNFWPLMTPNGKMRWKEDSVKTDVKVRRPIQFKISNTYIRRAANIMNDNDDTAQGMLAEWNYQNIVQGGNQRYRTQTFDAFRDTLRNNIHYYNHFARDPRSSGAFLTWRGEEHDFPTANLVKLLINNALFLTPRSTAYPTAYVPYMPYGSNDVDAIVNANILATLAALNIKSAGTSGATEFIEQKIKRHKWSRAGVYYPNRYQVHYSVVKAWSNGAMSLSNCISPLIEHIKRTQLPDGSFESRKIVNRKDIVQSTAYALNAMLKAGHPNETGLLVPIEKATAFLLQSARSKDQGIYWEGGVYFSGGTVIRNTLYWKSDALTTAIVAESLCLLRKYQLEKETDSQ